jgi:hypothetical protein
MAYIITGTEISMQMMAGIITGPEISVSMRTVSKNMYFNMLEVLTAALLQIQHTWDLKLCRWVYIRSSPSFEKS